MESQNSQATQYMRKRERRSRERERERERERRGRERSRRRHRQRSRSRSRRKRRKESRSRSRSRTPSRKYCDEEGHFIVEEGSNISSRFKILGSIGEGTFGKVRERTARGAVRGDLGQVVECWDRKEQLRVAVKVVRNVGKYRDGAKVEIQILEKVHRWASSRSSEWRHCCVRLRDCFDFYGHKCMVFDLYGLSLYDFIKKNKFVGFSHDLVKKFAFQVLAFVVVVASSESAAKAVLHRGLAARPRADPHRSEAREHPAQISQL